MTFDVFSIVDGDIPQTDQGSIKSVLRYLDRLRRQGNGPDLIILNESILRSIAQQRPNMLLPLDDWIVRTPSLKSDLEKVHPGYLEMTSVRGVTMGLPLFANMMMIAYNLDHLQSVGAHLQDNWNWDDFARVSAKLRSLSKDQLIPKSFLGNSPDLWLPFVLSNGGAYVSVEDFTLQLDRVPSIEALHWIRTQIVSGILHYYTVSAESWIRNRVTQQTPRLLLGQETASMIPAQSTLAWDTKLSSEFHSAIAFAPFPQSPITDHNATVLEAGYMIAIVSTSDKIDIAKQVAHRFLDPVIQAQIGHLVGGFPARWDASWRPNSAVPPTSEVVEGLALSRPFPPDLVNERYIWEPFFNPEYGFDAFMQGESRVDLFLQKVRGYLKPLNDAWHSAGQ